MFDETLTPTDAPADVAAETPDAPHVPARPVGATNPYLALPAAEIRRLIDEHESELVLIDAQLDAPELHAAARRLTGAEFKNWYVRASDARAHRVERLVQLRFAYGAVARREEERRVEMARTIEAQAERIERTEARLAVAEAKIGRMQAAMASFREERLKLLDAQRARSVAEGVARLQSLHADLVQWIATEDDPAAKSALLEEKEECLACLDVLLGRGHARVRALREALVNALLAGEVALLDPSQREHFLRVAATQVSHRARESWNAARRKGGKTAARMAAEINGGDRVDG